MLSKLALLQASEPELVDDDFPTVFADGIARAWVDGPNIKVILFRYALRHGVRVRVPVLELVRPIDTVTASLADMLKQFGDQPH